MPSALALPAARLLHTAMLSSHRFTLSQGRPQTASSNAWSYTPSQLRARLLARDLSSTAQRRASEDPVRTAELQHIFEQQQRLMRLLQEKPDVLENIKTFIKLVQDEGACALVAVGSVSRLTSECGVWRAGFDATSGRIPGKMEMLRLLMKPAIRESAMRMSAAFQEAGLNMESKVRRTAARMGESADCCAGDVAVADRDEEHAVGGQVNQ